MIVAGIDLSLTSTGVALVRAPERVETTRVQSSPPKLETMRTRHERMTTIRDSILKAVRDAHIVGIESPAYSVRGTGKMHDRSGLWWMVVTALIDEGKEVVEVAPTARAAYATGKGNAGKDLVLATVVRTYRHIDITGNDVADAVVIAAMMARLAGTPIEIGKLPESKARSLAKVRFPELLAA